jgi:hypothetical protein
MRLAHYVPTPGNTPVESFFTELIGHLLEQDKAAKEEYLRIVLGNTWEVRRWRPRSQHGPLIQNSAVLGWISF